MRLYNQGLGFVHCTTGYLERHFLSASFRHGNSFVSMIWCSLSLAVPSDSAESDSDGLLREPAQPVSVTPSPVLSICFPGHGLDRRKCLEACPPANSKRGQRHHQHAPRSALSPPPLGSLGSFIFDLVPRTLRSGRRFIPFRSRLPATGTNSFFVCIIVSRLHDCLHNEIHSSFASSTVGLMYPLSGMILALLLSFSVC